MVAEHDLDAVTYQFMALGEDERTVTLPFVGVSRLMAEGIGYGGEGDWVTATFLRGVLAAMDRASYKRLERLRAAAKSKIARAELDRLLVAHRPRDYGFAQFVPHEIAMY